MERLRPLFYKNFIFVIPQTIKKLLPGNLPLSPFAKGGLNSPLPLREWDRVRGRRIEVIPNGISPDLQGVISEESDYILYLGSIDIYGKGLGVLVNAYAEFLKSFPHIRLVIAGDGRDRKKFEAMIRRMPDQARKNIEMPGRISDDEKAEVIGKAISVIFPSRHEVQSIAVLEAMACGKPVIVSNIQEFAYATDIGSGILFRTGDPSALADAMKKILRSSDRRAMGQKVT